MLLYVHKGEKGTGTDRGRGGGKGRKRVNGRPEDRRGRGPPPEQQLC